MTPPHFQLQYNPADIPSLAAEYMRTQRERDQEMEDAGRRIANGPVRRSDLETIYRWKSARRIALFRKNTDLQIELALEEAIKRADIKQAICSLARLDGVGVKMASAILTAIDPERYTVLDFRALEALGARNSDDVDLYVLYVEACRNMAKQYGVKMRDFDRANWQWSKRKSKLNENARNCRGRK
jgi:hypothetical protein